MFKEKIHTLKVAPLIVLLIVCLSFFVSQVWAPSRAEASTSEMRNELEQLRNRLSDVEDNISDYEAGLNQLKQEKDGLARELSETEMKKRQVEEELKEARIALQIAELELEEAKEELEEAEEELRYREGLLHGRVRAMYELGTVSYLEVLLTASSFSDFVTRFNMLQDIVTEDVNIVESVAEQRDEVERKKEELVVRRQEADEWNQRVAERKQELEVQVARYENRLDDLQDRESEYRAAVDELERRSEQIASEISEKQQELALADGVPYLEWPIDPGYHISSPYGMRYHPVLGEQRMHTGIDVAAPTGTPVYAMGDGVVMDAGWMGGYGLTVIIAHTSSYSTLYAHNSTLLVEPGQEVSLGQQISRVGTTGMSTGPHLHFEVREDGQHKNPVDYLPSR